MTEKRFTFAYETNDQYCIWWAVRDGDRTLWKEEVVGLLNQLNDENEQLKQDGFYWAETAEARRKEIDKLRKDNSILKQQRDYLFDVIDEVLPHSGSTTVYNRMKNIGDVQ